MARYMGIDPGRQGAIAVIDGEDMSVVVHDMPATIEGKRAVLSEIGAVRFCWIEKPFYPRMIGVKNVATIAQGYGEIRPAFSTRAGRRWKCRRRIGKSTSA